MVCFSLPKICRLASEAFDTARAAVLPLWQDVADGFKAWTGEPAGACL